MAEKVKPTIEELQKKLEDTRKLSEKYRNQLEERVTTKPLESAGIIFIVGIILGILIGAATSRRS